MSFVLNTQSRMSPLQIEDPLIRVELYREIRNYQETPPDDWTEYEIQAADALMPELIAYKVYKLDTLKWVVMIAAGLDDPRERLEVGSIIHLPPAVWIRERIKYWQTFEQIGR